MNNRADRILLSLSTGLLAVLVVLVSVNTFSSVDVSIDDPVARGDTLWATRAFTTSTMTISSSAITVSNTGFGWSSTDLTDAEVAVVSVHSQAINITWDANDPTATKGRNIAAGGTIRIEGTPNVGNLRFIRSGGSDGVVSVTLEK